MDRDLLRKLQKTELQILLDVDKFCRAHEIPYSLYGGTALGAVRHSGFIPWDDDLDIVMTRDNFNRFWSLWRDIVCKIHRQILTVGLIIRRSEK